MTLEMSFDRSRSWMGVGRREPLNLKYTLPGTFIWWRRNGRTFHKANRYFSTTTELDQLDTCSYLAG